MELLNIGQAERLKGGVHVGNEGLDGCVVLVIESSSCLGRDTLVDEVPGHVFADQVQRMEVDH